MDTEKNANSIQRAHLSFDLMTSAYSFERKPCASKCFPRRLYSHVYETLFEVGDCS